VAAVVAVSTVVWLGMATFVAARVLSDLHVGLSSCLPADFPDYPNKRLASVVVSDVQGDCTIQYRTPDSTSQVQSFFESHLNDGDWTVTSVDEQGGRVTFQRVSDPLTAGYVRVFGFPGETQFQVQIQTG
jgi:hypothetical protein